MEQYNKEFQRKKENQDQIIPLKESQFDQNKIFLQSLEILEGIDGYFLQQMLLENDDLLQQLQSLDKQYNQNQQIMLEDSFILLNLQEIDNFQEEQDQLIQINNLQSEFEIDFGVINQLFYFVGKDETEKLLKIALEVCHGDKNQAANILVSNPIELIEFENLEEIQKNVLKQVGQNSIKAQQEVYGDLIKRFVRLGFKQQDLDCVLQYIRDDAQIIVHFRLHQIINILGKKNNMRLKNTFEVNKSNDQYKNNRKGWEKNMFFGKYDQYSLDEDYKRPKYGVFNIFNNPNGVKNCYFYGKSFFVLKNTRLRTTFTYKDSCGLSDKEKDNYKNVSTCQYYGFNLSQLSDKELTDLVNTSQMILKSKITQYPEQEIFYKELQIHGEIFVDQHIEEIHYSKSELELYVGFSTEKINKKNRHSPIQKTNQQYLEKFCKKFPHIKAFPIE